MTLNEAQKQEIAAYIKGIAAYAETYNELYDHILSAMSSDTHRSFSMDVVAEIINEDFGGVKKIKTEEENHQNQHFQSFSRSFKKEVLNSFKFPAIIGNLTILALCYIISKGDAAEETKTKVILMTIFILSLTPILLYLLKIYIIDKHQIKPSINNPALKSVALLGIHIANLTYFSFLQKDAIFGLSSSTKYSIMLLTFFILGVYIRTYLKIFNNTLKLKLR